MHTLYYACCDYVANKFWFWFKEKHHNKWLGPIYEDFFQNYSKFYNDTKLPRNYLEDMLLKMIIIQNDMTDVWEIKQWTINMHQIQEISIHLFG